MTLPSIQIESLEKFSWKNYVGIVLGSAIGFYAYIFFLEKTVLAEFPVVDGVVSISAGEQMLEFPSYFLRFLAGIISGLAASRLWAYRTNLLDQKTIRSAETNTIQSGSRDAYILRSLSDQEKATLSTQKKFTFPRALLKSAVFLLYGMFLLTSVESVASFRPLIALVLALLAGKAAFEAFMEYRNLSLDLQDSAVHQIEGFLVKESKLSRSDSFCFHVSNQKFQISGKTLGALLTPVLEQYEPVRVLFSPHSRHVWQLESTNRPQISYSSQSSEEDLKNRLSQIQPAQPAEPYKHSYREHLWGWSIMIIGVLILGLIMISVVAL